MRESEEGIWNANGGTNREQWLRYENTFPLKKKITLENAFKASETMLRTLKLLTCSLLETCDLSLREQGMGCKI